MLVDLSLVVIYLFVSGWLLLAFTIITAYLITCDGHAPRKKEQVAYHYAGLLAEMGKRFRHNMHMYILHLRHEDVILVIMCTGLPITTTIADQWLKVQYSLIISSVL